MEVHGLYRHIGRRIQQFRTERHLSQDELARMVGISRTSVVNIEKGRQRLPIHTLWEIAGALHVDPHALLPGAEAATHATALSAVQTLEDVPPEAQPWLTEIIGQPGGANGTPKKDS